jgi:hypothetical protein
MAYNTKHTRHSELEGNYTIRGSYRLVCSTGSVTIVAARTATAGFLFTQRWSSSTSANAFIKYVGAKFTCTTAYGTVQETGCDLIIARSYTASATGGTAVDMGSTVANTGNLLAAQQTSLFAANATRVATTDAFTAGTQTLDANPIGILSDWTAAIGITVPSATSGVGNGFGTLFDARTSRHEAPIVLVQDEGIVIRNLILMGATGVGRWDFCVEWDEGTPR